MLYRCNKCKDKPPCVLNTEDAESAPETCPMLNRFDVEAGYIDLTPRWRPVKRLCDKLLDLLEWKDKIYNDGVLDGEYPAWFWDAITLEDRYWELLRDVKDALEKDQYLYGFAYESEIGKVLKPISKRDLASAIARMAFSAGVAYGEFRRKVLKEKDWEIIHDDDDTSIDEEA